MRFSDLDRRRIAVWGIGVEISSFVEQLAARLPASELLAVVLDDPGQTSAARALAGDGARVLRAEQVGEVDFGVLVRSPGVSVYRPELRVLCARGVTVTTPTALWLAEREGRSVLGITATKGKSTTANLAAHLARRAGVAVELAGNIGRPALDLLDQPADELAIVELSSYQIADLTVGPETAYVGNLFKEHVTWHGTEQRYRDDKLRLMRLPGVRRCVVNALSEAILEAVPPGLERWTFGTSDGWHLTAEGVAFGSELLVANGELPLLGPHNALNLCGALTALAASGVLVPPLPDSLTGITALPHRLQPIFDQDGVLWVDDSISTTPESAIAAIESFPGRPITLIGGGQDRGQEYAELGTVLARRDAVVIGMPDTGGRLLEAARHAGLAPTRLAHADGLEAAARLARSHERPGTVVLLSPAAPSYHVYRNFEERGDHFAALAKTI